MWWDRCCDCSRQPKTPFSSLSLSLSHTHTYAHTLTLLHPMQSTWEHPCLTLSCFFASVLTWTPLSLSLVFILRRLLKSWTHCWEKEREGPLQMVPLSPTRSHVPPTFEYYLTWFAASPTRNLSCIDFSR
jgi:hypothetical protein